MSLVGHELPLLRHHRRGVSWQRQQSGPHGPTLPRGARVPDLAGTARVLGRIGPSGPGQRSPGPPRPPARLTTKDVEGRERQRTTERLSYVLVASN